MKLVAVPDVILPDGTVRRGTLPEGGGGEYAYEPALTAGVIPGFFPALPQYSFMPLQPSEPPFRMPQYWNALAGMSVYTTNQVSLINLCGI